MTLSGAQMLAGVAAAGGLLVWAAPALRERARRGREARAFRRALRGEDDDAAVRRAQRQEELPVLLGALVTHAEVCIALLQEYAALYGVRAFGQLRGVEDCRAQRRRMQVLLELAREEFDGIQLAVDVEFVRVHGSVGAVQLTCGDRCCVLQARRDEVPGPCPALVKLRELASSLRVEVLP